MSALFPFATLFRSGQPGDQRNYGAGHHRLQASGDRVGWAGAEPDRDDRSDEHTSELQSLRHLVCQPCFPSRRSSDLANRETNGITVLDIIDYKLVAIVSVGQGPSQIVMTPAPERQYVLVLNETSGDLAVIRTRALATTPNGAQRRLKSAPLFTLIPVGERPVSAAVVTL